MRNMVTIERVKKYAPYMAEVFNGLLDQLNSDIPKRRGKFIAEILDSPFSQVFVVRHGQDRKIIGMATLVVYQVMSGKRGTVEDVVVNKDYRRQGIGKKLLERVLEEADSQNISYIDLTSRPTRVDANNMYKSLGFTKRDTNVYRYLLKK